MVSQRNGVLKDVDRAAFQVLGLDADPDTYDVQDVDSRWRELRSQLHPDRPGGDAAKFDTTRKAYEAARFYALEPKPCPTCKGNGKIDGPAPRGFGPPIRVNCSACRGSGQR